MLEQLNAARSEARTLREQVAVSQKSRQEVLLVRDQTDAGSTALLRFEVDFQVVQHNETRLRLGATCEVAAAEFGILR